MKRAIFLTCLLVGAWALPVQADWPTTAAEDSDYRKTGTYSEVLEFVEGLAERSERADWRIIGHSEEGRPIGLLAVGADQAPDPEALADKDVVFVTAGIHPGEVAGTDAGLALVRDLLSGQARLGEDTVLLFLPVFNVDGHERAGRWHRINQDGPRETGWRSNAANLNLNRDFMKADSREMRAWLEAFETWEPHLVLDLHTTNGADFQYDITYIIEHDDFLPDPAREWKQSAFFDHIFPSLEDRGHKLAPYIWLRDGEDPAAGFDFFIATPRFSSGYAAIRNRPGMMLEMHALKDYETRVRGSYNTLLATLEYLDEHPGRLREAVADADAEIAALGKETEQSFPLDLELTGEEEPFEFRTWEWSLEEIDPIGKFLRYDTDRPTSVEVPYGRETRVSTEVRPPAAYIVPPSARDVIERLEAHGIRTYPLPETMALNVEQLRISEVGWQEAPYEGRQVVDELSVSSESTERELPEGSRVVPLADERAGLVMHLLEPEAPDSLFRWGFFNQIFQNSEYAEPRILARKAAEKLDRDPELARAWRERMEEDPEFAEDRMARIAFLYEKGPWFDDRLGIYPVIRLHDPERLERILESDP